MSNAAVTANASRRFVRRRPIAHRRDDSRVTAHTVILQDLATSRLNDDGLSERHGGEFLAVPIAIFGLCEILGDDIVRKMAIDALRRGVVTRLLPRVEL